ncbi:unnamed protein product, partial [Closterium sp. NIES-54]
ACVHSDHENEKDYLLAAILDHDVTNQDDPIASPAANNSNMQQHQQQQHQQQQYQQQPMYGMPLSNQSVHAAAAAASAAAAAATAASAATTAAAAVTGSTNQPGQQSGFVPTGPYQYQGAYQPTNLQQRVDAAVSSLYQMFPGAMILDGSSYQRGQSPQGSDGSNSSFSFVPGGQGQQASQGSHMPSLYQLQSADCQRSTGDPRLILGKDYRHVGLGERRSRVRIPVYALRASQCGGVSEVHW